MIQSENEYRFVEGNLENRNLVVGSRGYGGEVVKPLTSEVTGLILGSMFSM